MKLMTTMPYYTSKSVKLFLGSALILSISACTPAPKIEDKPAVERQEVKQAKTQSVTKVTAPKVLTIAEHKQLRIEATEKGNWADYLFHSDAIWQKADKKEQQEIENQAWNVVNSLSTYERNKLRQSDLSSVNSWFALYEYINGLHRNDEIELLNLRTYYEDAIFNAHLLPTLLAQQPDAQKINKIAVLLPMQGKYKIVSQQIRSGITKAFYASEQKVTLEFYDSTDLSELENIYTQAKQSGADRIIGPLRKSAVRQLASFHDTNMLALNSIENSTIPQFNFKSANPNIQMVGRFNKQNYERIGIMTNDKPRNVAEAKELQTLWQQTTGHQAELNIYPDERPRLREALGTLIHENLSQERKNNVAWAIHEQLDFFPRTRNDLDAIVIIDDARRLAVFRPQFDFFELNIPLYSNSQLSPRDFQQQKPNKDLRDVQFLTYPAVISAEDLLNKFEAFGWDSFLISTHFEQMQQGACLTSAKTGILHMDGLDVKQQQIWVKFNRDGTLDHAPLVMATNKKFKNNSLQDSENTEITQQNGISDKPLNETLAE